jgi:pyruvate formate lyase activating enzyme
MEHKGVIFDIRRFCVHDGPGIRTTIFFKGCPLDCQWCHNPEGRSFSVETFILNNESAEPGASVKARNSTVGKIVAVDEVVREVMRDEPFYDRSGGGATFSGGEPMMQIDFLDRLLDAFAEQGVSCVVDTCGYAPFEDFERICDRAKLFLFDLKIIDAETHRKYTGVSNEIILSNFIGLTEKGCQIEARIPLIPDITDTQENLEAIASFLRPLPSIRKISILPYNRLGEDKIKRFNLPRRNLSLDSQDSETLERRAIFFREFGYEVRIGG